MKIIYTASVTTTGGRSGEVKSSDGLLDFSVGVPGAPGPEKTNPEQLFAAGYSACFGSALDVVARQAGKELTHNEVIADVSLGKTENHTYGLAVKLTGVLGGVTQEEADELVKAAHKVCPYSNATRGNVDVDLEARIKP